MMKFENSSQEEISEINVTPFIDVLLVLLVIFMVTIPISTVTIPLELPASNSQSTASTDKPIILSLTAENKLFLGDKPITHEQLADNVYQQTQGNFNSVIFFHIDKQVNYAELMGVMNILRQAGYLKIGLVGLNQGEEMQ
ncbi:outer membrane transport energization protein ExbD [Nicoletella semolina]|uniref:Outer membrane transport energization protein ExbD n=1 Tax=Nicoletella semolina TaxID=271160 RepID=A0A4R2N4W1_9PAST|nr:biopolymer transporter ExbD [Nicoletella semolina]TCP15902.1 outer membrane transport energization protein ExbD [Nicoletella semolina]